MSLSVMTSKGQITIPKVVRDILRLMPSDKVIITVEKDHAILKPVHGNILDIGGSIRIPESEKPIDFHKVREKVKKAVSRVAAKKTEG